MIPSSQGCYKSLLTLSAIFPCLAHSQPLSQISIATGILQQDYREFSASAPNGILDRETGNLNIMQIQANYLPTLSIGKLNLPLYLQGQYRQSTGNTQYDGYLQQGYYFTPYHTETANTIKDGHLRLGARIDVSNQWQLAPYTEYGQHRWLRTLTQYQETFRHNNLSFGVLTQYQPVKKWQLQLDVATGQIKNAHINIPNLKFSASLGNERVTNLDMTVNYNFSQKLSVGLSGTYSEYRYGASNVITGLQEPDSLSRQHTLAIQLTYLR